MKKHLAISLCLLALASYSAYGQGCDAGCKAGCNGSLTDCCGTCGTACGGCPQCGMFSGCGGCGLVGGCNQGGGAGGGFLDRLGGGGELFGDGRGGGCGLGGGCGVAGACGSNCCGSCGGACGSCPSKYVQLYGGYFRTQEIDTDFAVNIANGPGIIGSIGIHTNNGYAAGGSIGKYIGCRLRGELDFTFRNATFDRLEFSVGGLPPTLVALQGKMNMYSALGNLYFDINRGGGISPYVGVGGGVVFNRADIIEPTLPVVIDLDWSSFAYQLIGGVAIKLTHRASVFAEYRYFGTDTFKLGIGTPVGSFAAESDITSHNGFVGLRIDLP